ncbi:MAG: hypothetical protein DRR08_24745 [Candidatus Parabeggiatoa sp. nov. 2]|nr:MAG: hypothetical protein B6247_28905 [Beggiatoa sp. 4572_84]RKZ55280.1 MAG: hypothetical protein DRR08_24745 [Gammaproteobacteria bacterium]
MKWAIHKTKLINYTTWPPITTRIRYNNGLLILIGKHRFAWKEVAFSRYKKTLKQHVFSAA